MDVTRLDGPAVSDFLAALQGAPRSREEFRTKLMALLARLEGRESLPRFETIQALWPMRGEAAFRSFKKRINDLARERGLGARLSSDAENIWFVNVDEAAVEMLVATLVLAIRVEDQFQGTEGQIRQTKEHFHSLIRQTFADLIVVLRPTEHGCVVSCGGKNCVDQVLFAADRLIGLLPFFNRSRGHLNFLPRDLVHVRIFADTVAESSERLAAATVAAVERAAVDVGVRDHIIVSDAVRCRIESEHLLKRLRLNEQLLGVDQGGGLVRASLARGALFILDADEAEVTLQRNVGREAGSDAILAWIDALTKEEGFDQLDLLSYTNQRLSHLLFHPSFRKFTRIRVLMRSWMTEERQELEFLRRWRVTSTRDGQDDEIIPPPRSDVIRASARMMALDGGPGPVRGEPPAGPGSVEVRFYTEPPWLKGAILKNSNTKRRAAHIGLYRRESRAGGWRYSGSDWSALWLSEDEGAKTSLLDTVCSRFEELWETGTSYEKMVHDERKGTARSKEKADREIWQIDRGVPYMLAVAARWSEPAKRLIYREDEVAARRIERKLTDLGATVDVVAFDLERPDFAIMQAWKGHIVLVCQRMFFGECKDIFKRASFPYVFEGEGVREGATVAYRTVKHTMHHAEFSSPNPVGSSTHIDRDYGVVARVARGSDGTSWFLVAGLRAPGTLGGAQFLTDSDHLVELHRQIQDADFATLIEAKVDAKVLYDIEKVRVVIPPDLLQRQGLDAAGMGHQAS